MGGDLIASARRTSRGIGRWRASTSSQHGLRRQAQGRRSARLLGAARHGDRKTRLPPGRVRRRARGAGDPRERAPPRVRRPAPRRPRLRRRGLIGRHRPEYRFPARVVEPRPGRGAAVPQCRGCLQRSHGAPRGMEARPGAARGCDRWRTLDRHSPNGRVTPACSNPATRPANRESEDHHGEQHDQERCIRSRRGVRCARHLERGSRSTGAHAARPRVQGPPAVTEDESTRDAPAEFDWASPRWRETAHDPSKVGRDDLFRDDAAPRQRGAIDQDGSVPGTSGSSTSGTTPPPSDDGDSPGS